jgi:hypothetical protein
MCRRSFLKPETNKAITQTGEFMSYHVSSYKPYAPKKNEGARFDVVRPGSGTEPARLLAKVSTVASVQVKSLTPTSAQLTGSSQLVRNRW